MEEGEQAEPRDKNEKPDGGYQPAQEWETVLPW